jgi:hypothetical protein
MTKDQAIGFHADMEALFAQGPGGIDDEARHQLQRIRFACHPAPDGHGYLREKILEACGSLDTWLSPEKWKRWGENPKVFQHLVRNDLYKVRMAIDTAFREPTR